MGDFRIFNLQVEMHDFETRMLQWRQRYQEFQQSLAEFRQWQASFAYQMELHNQKHRDLQDIRTDLKRFAQEQTWKRKMYY